MKQNKIGIVILCLGLFSGCAFTDAKLDIDYDAKRAIAGPLSNVTSQQIKISGFTDSRPETHLVGYKRNGFGQHTADITPKKPVPEIVTEAVSAVFKKGGHSIIDSGSIEISGDIKTFWFDVKTGFWTVQFMGNTAIHLTVKDAVNGSIIYEKDYRGSHTEESMGGLEGTWERVLNEALVKMAENISLDTALAKALKNHARATETQQHASH